MPGESEEQVHPLEEEVELRAQGTNNWSQQDKVPDKGTREKTGTSTRVSLKS